MSEPGSVTQWIAQLKAGDRVAAQALWEGCYRQLVARARAKLAGAPRRAADEEDVALSAFDSFYRAAEQGHFPQLHDREDLWQLLMLIVDRKAINLIHAERRQRRGGGKVLDEAALAGGATATSVTALAWVPGQEPSPEFAAQAADEYRRLLHILADADLQRVAVQKMAGYSVEEIAAEMKRAPRTIKRWLQLIRRTWKQELPE
jgi:DNA-directed RNA polymerase specialized sigma24 family protein